MSSRWLTNEGDKTAPPPVNLNHLVRNATYDEANHKIVLQKHDNITTVDVNITTLGAHDTSLTQHSNSITALENAGYQTQTQVDSNITARGYQTQAQVDSNITGRGYQTSADVDSNITARGYQTSSDVDSNITARGYQTSSDVDSNITARGYQTSSDVSTYVTGLGYQTATQIANLGYETTANLLNRNYQTQSDVSSFISSQNLITNTANNLTNYYDKNHSNNTFLDGISLSGKTLTIDRQASSFNIALPIADSIDPSPFAAMRWVDSNENTLTRGTIAAQIKSTTNVSGDDSFGSSITLDGGLQVTGNQQYITEDFIMDTEDGYGVLEIMFGSVANLSGTLFKIETVDYRKLTDSFDANWGDTEFKIHNGQMYIESNGGSNDVIRCTDSGYPSAGIYFIHAGGATGQNPSGFSTNLGRYSNKSDIGKAREAAGAVQSWNNANSNNVGSSGPINDHYYARGDSLLGLFRNSRELEEFNVGGMSHFALWKGGPEFLNGGTNSGTFSIASGDHIMIQVDKSFVKVWKNGNLTTPARNIPNGVNNNANARVGGVTTLRKRLIIGNTGNSGNLSFTVEKFKWHGNKKDTDQLRSIYDDRSFNPTGGGSTVSDVDLTPYFNGISYNNSAAPPQLTLQSASGNSTVNLRDCYTKSQVYTKTEVDALLNTERARITALESSLSTVITTVNNILSVLTYIGQWAANITTVVAGLSSGQGNSGGSGGGFSINLPGNVNNPFSP